MLRPEKPALGGLAPESLEALLAPLPPFRSRQILTWIYRRVSSFDEMTNLPKALRSDLAARFILYSSAVSACFEDPDGTAKLQITLWDGARIEAVLLSDGGGRKTACLSTQAGCPAGCVFCKTGLLGFRRDLDSAEIVEQFLHLRSKEAEIANIVIMGMGEPLLNLEEVRRALLVFTSPDGLALSPRRITLSTCGIAEGIRELADKGPPVRLALSLTTADEALRERLMPLALTNPLATLKDTLAYYQQRTGRRLTLEAVLLGGINTRPEDADALAAFAGGLEAAVNLIPWNPVDGLSFEGRPLQEPGRRELRTFTAALEKRGLNVTQRFRKGRSIAGACGQLGVVHTERFVPRCPVNSR
ncbi:MAG: 23S rRNA (adenine(2503)-C(2))-methyltransferase RlmN [Treponema sp.]|jgi:23S rRNA (adenine2503-C2)-methyltransferase|nr:23S rRNA (adenine(2503)-C(2))-methyltransferase RlmN [Treponema sp.]